MIRISKHATGRTHHGLMRRPLSARALSIIVCVVLLLYAGSASVVGAAGIGEDIGNAVGNVLLSLAAFLTWIGGVMLDQAVGRLILGMGQELSKPEIKAAIENSWVIIRDVCNLAFVFGFVWIGIKTIVDYGSASTRSLLASLIVAALLINFSLFFTRVIIDVSNMAAYQVYATMLGPELVESNVGIGTKFMNTLGIVTVFDTQTGWASLDGLTADASLGFYFGAAMFLLITAFVFAAGAILIAIRFAALLLIMIFSPVLFAATVFPQTKQFSTKLWGLLINHALFAPIYLLLVLVSYRVAAGLSGPASAAETFSSALRSNPQSFGVFITFLVITILMVMALQSAKQLSVAGGTKAVSLGRSMARSALGGTTGYTGRGVTRFLGLDKIANSVEEMQKSGKPGDRARAGFLRATGINAVAASATKAKWGSGRSVADVDKKNKEIGTSRARNRQAYELSQAVTRATSGTFKTTQERDAAMIAMERAIGGATTEQLLGVLKQNKGNPKVYSAIVANLSGSQFENLMKAKEEDLNDSEKRKLRDARTKAVEGGLGVAAKEGATSGEKAAALRNLSRADKEQLKSVQYENLLSGAHYLQDSQIKALDGILTGTQLAKVKEARKEKIMSYGKTVSGAREIVKSRTTEEEIAKLPVGFLNSEQFVEAAVAEGKMTISLLSKIATGSDADKRAIGRNVLKKVPETNRKTYQDWFNSGLGLQFR